ASTLRGRGVTRIFVCGLATEFCVKQTALDGVAEGFDVFLIENACRGINFPQGSAAAAVEEMRQAGVKVCWSGDLAQ
ncbi:MAG: isochorismatase family protein, partial [Candidatus Hydrogenedentes bacterium]|nr:isochorismatase family protein [Candidatus Hydrogenedentota bacterium]